MSAVLGADVQRVGAAQKVTGQTLFAADHGGDRVAYAAIVPARIGKGRVTRIETSAAEAAPSVVLVLTYSTIDRLQPPGFLVDGGTGFQSIAVMQDETIAYRGQPVAIVVAETYDAAIEATSMVDVEYDEMPFSVALDAPDAETLPQEDALKIPDKDLGDVDGALAASGATVVTADYHGPPQHQNPMELLATFAEWTDDGHLVVHESTQNAQAVAAGVAHQLGIDADTVRVISPYAGGAFGQKNSLASHTVLAAVVARRVARPVKLVIPRDQAFHNASFRPSTRHRMTLAADREGRMVAAVQETWQQTSRHDLLPSMGSDATSRLYGITNFRSADYLVRTDVQTPGFMRAPWEHMAVFAYESAVDELAYALEVDPVELRLRSDTATDPVSGKPFSSRYLHECLTRAATLFGWQSRAAKPGSMRASNGHLLGWGVAAGCYPGSIGPARARVELRRDGRVAVSVGGHEMGQGLRTAIALVVAARLGVAPENVRITMGDTAYPPQHLTAGSSGTATSCPAVAAACDALLRGLDAPDHGSARALEMLQRSGNETATGEASHVGLGQSEDALGAAANGQLVTAGPEYDDFVTFSFVAHFVEVMVDPETFVVRVPRTVSVVDCGKVLSRRTAASQVRGAVVWGISAALREMSEVDGRFGGFLNANLAEYKIAVNADVGDAIVDFIDEPDTAFNVLGAKSVGEVAMIGVAPAVANAVYHATGRRVRRLPIRLDDFHGQ